MKRSKFEIAFEIFAWITIIIGFLFIAGFIFIFVNLYNYGKCEEQEFVPKYCEKYKNY